MNWCFFWGESFCIEFDTYRLGSYLFSDDPKIYLTKRVMINKKLFVLLIIIRLSINVNNLINLDFKRVKCGFLITINVHKNVIY